MRCMICEELSFKHICLSCQKALLTPSLYKRNLYSNVPVYSFYKYNEIEPLLLSKHTDLGYYIYSILAQNSFASFGKTFEYPSKVCSVGIDDHVRRGYSHTAILNKCLESSVIKPRFSILRAKSRVSYSGKSYQERLLNPRQFIFKSFVEEDVILVDDIITTGLTLTQGIQEMQKQGKNVLFCLTLADAGN